MIGTILDLSANLALLIAISTLSGFIRQRWEQGRTGAMLQGLLFGLAAVFGMLRPVVLEPGIIFDGRSVVISLCGMFFGPLAALLAGSAAAACRIVQGGAGALTGSLVIASSVLIGLVFYWNWKRRGKDPSAWSFFRLGLAAHVAMLLLMFTLPGGAGPAVLKKIGLPVILTYPLVTVIIGKILMSHIVQRRAVVTLRESEERYRSILTASPDIIAFTDMVGKVLMTSPASLKLFGYDRPEELLGRNVFEFLLPEDRERAKVSRARLLAGGSAEIGQYKALRRDGSIFDIEVNSEFTRTADGRPMNLVLVIRDVTARKQADEALQQTREVMSLFVRHSPIHVYMKQVTPEESRVLLASDNFIDMIGISGQDMKGKTMAELFPSEFAEKISADDWDVVSRGEVLHVDEELNGRKYTTIKFPIHVGEESFLAGYTIDITDRVQMEEERRRLESQLLQAQKMESMGILAGGVAHDMNNVLGAIMGLASAGLETEPPGSPAHKAFDTILKASVRGGKMVRSLLSFARQSLAEEKVLDLNAILREQVGLLERTTLARIQLALDLDPKLRPLRGDSNALAHAFMNLFVNALDAIPASGTITLRTRNAVGGWIEAQLEDSGSGMPKDVLDKAVDPFFTTKEQGKGTGLGLSLVFSTVKAHGGQMDIQSEVGRGTRVTLRFPSCSADLPGDEKQEGVSGVESAKAGLTVLLVDDDDLIQSSCQRILNVLKHKTVIASSGEEALERLGAGLRPDVVVLDLNMPGLSGAATLPLIRDILPAVPVLLATGRADQAALALAEKYPGVTLLPKPFGMKDLQSHLANMVKTRALSFSEL